MDFVFRDIGEVKTFVFNMKYVLKIKTHTQIYIIETMGEISYIVIS